MSEHIELRLSSLAQPSAISVDTLIVEDGIQENDLLIQRTQFSGHYDTTTIPSDAIDHAVATNVDNRDEHIFGSIKFLSPWFPQVDPNKYTWKSRRSTRKAVIWSSFISIWIVFLCNFVFSIVVWKRYRMTDDGVATLYEGECSSAKLLDASLHVVINILSTIMLGMSNLMLQLMVSPTRNEIDKAHRAGKWLDIGVPSIRNMRNLPRWTLFVAFMLTISSLPIHFLYNATIFQTVSMNSYLYMTVTEGFLKPLSEAATLTADNGTIIPAPRGIELSLQTFNNDVRRRIGAYTEPWADFDRRATSTVKAIHDDVQNNLPSYKRLSSFECLELYGDPYKVRPNVLLVSNDYETAIWYNTSLLQWSTVWPKPSNHAILDPIVWTRDSANWGQPLMTITPDVIENWKVRGNRIQYCLQVPDTDAAEAFKLCRVQCAPILLLIISIFNLFKCSSALWLLFGRAQNTLCTLGDAIASFLEHPDEVTENFGVATFRSIVDNVAKDKKTLKGVTQAWRPKDIRRYQAGSPARWILTMTMCLIVFIVASFYFSRGLSVVKKYYNVGFSQIDTLGFGTPSYKQLIEWNQKKQGALGLFVNILIANIWQVLVSLCYVVQNALLSCQLVAAEWTGFASERKPLRVSHPIGIQRSTYFVSMPLRYGVPVMTLFALEHWLLSQTTFIVRVMYFDFTVTPFKHFPGWTTAGFSLMPALLAIILPALLLFFQLGHGIFRKYKKEDAMPFVTTCSLAISANCHRPSADFEAHLLPVQWGVIEQSSEGVQKCAFTTLRTVKGPAVGSLVFGLSEELFTRRRAWWNANHYRRTTEICKQWIGSKKDRRSWTSL